jgi:preprotein translocase SecF subunit
MLHDVLAVLGVLYLLDKEVTLLIVTALLTLAGYSLTDKVVVFDRIRENLRRRRQEPLSQVINASINQVLSRTVIVSLNFFFAVLALYVWGGDVLHDFSFAMLLGVIVGTYSSIFVASPLLMFWRGAVRI